MSEHRLELAKELLEDIEYSRLPVDALLLKASRLARVMGAEATGEWLKYEMRGYNGSDHAIRLMVSLGRMINPEKEEGYFDSLSAIEAAISSMEIQMKQLRVPDFHFAPSSVNPREFVTEFGAIGKAANASNEVMLRLHALTNNITRFKSIRSRTISALQSFVAETYYELEFSGLAESVFDKHKSQIDAMLAEAAGDAMTKVPAIYDRLMSDDPEAISQALNSCRRMIKAFADSVYPSKESTVEVDGESYKLGSDKILNRIEAYLSEKCRSKSRRSRLNATVRGIYHREAAGSHSDVTADEARSLFLATYLVLGEILLATKDAQDSAAMATSPPSTAP